MAPPRSLLILTIAAALSLLVCSLDDPDQSSLARVEAGALPPLNTPDTPSTADHSEGEPCLAESLDDPSSLETLIGEDNLPEHYEGTLTDKEERITPVSEPPRKAPDLSADSTGIGSAGQQARFVPEVLRLGPLSFKVLATPEGFKGPEAGPDVVRYRVMVERGLEDDAEAFVDTVEDVLSEPEGWASVGLGFVRVVEDFDITVLLASPKTVDTLCSPLDTNGLLSCGMMRRANLNHHRWTIGSKTWGDDLAGYRRYLINHEVGHLLGLQHFRCPAPGEPAPVMLPQTKYLAGCTANARPTDKERKILGMALKYWRKKRERLATQKTLAAEQP